MEKTTIKNIILIHGLILGILSMLIAVVKYAFANNYLEKNVIEQIVSILIMLIMIVIPIKAFKKSNNSFLSLSQSIKIGLGVSLIASLLVIIYIYVFSNFIEPDFKNQLISIEIKKMEVANTPSKTIETAVDMMNNYFMPIMYFSIIIVNLLLGLIFSLITGLVLKKEENNFN